MFIPMLGGKDQMCVGGYTLYSQAVNHSKNTKNLLFYFEAENCWYEIDPDTDPDGPKNHGLNRARRLWREDNK